MLHFMCRCTEYSPNSAPLIDRIRRASPNPIVGVASNPSPSATPGATSTICTGCRWSACTTHGYPWPPSLYNWAQMPSFSENSSVPTLQIFAMSAPVADASRLRGTHPRSMLQSSVLPWAMALSPLGPAQIQSHFSRVPSTIFSLCADSHYVGHTADRPGWAKHCTMNASVYCCSTYCTVTYSTVPSTYRILHLESIVVWKVSDTPQGA
jgi:hypothetical protein